jgi:hypothetical protein
MRVCARASLLLQIERGGPAERCVAVGTSCRCPAEECDCMNEVNEAGPKSRVFISHAAADKMSAARIAHALRESKTDASVDVWELQAGDSIAHRTEAALASSDFFVVLLSTTSVTSRWVAQELNVALAAELQERAITIIPVLIEDCPIPPTLANRLYIDLRSDFEKGLRRLIEQLDVAPQIRFSKLDPQAFEKLVGDLLTAQGFDVKPQRSSADRGFDFVATITSKDPFGAQRIDNWLVEAKFYREQRVAVSTLRQLFGYLVTTPGPSKAVVITNGQLTSVAREFLSEIQSRTGRELRVIDGAELTTLLLQHPSLVEQYFSGTGRP